MQRRQHARGRPGALRAGAIAGLLCLVATPALPAVPACAPEHREPYAPWVFFGYACTGRCHAQKAGFAWAERHGIGNAAACPGGEGPFVEGCRTYADVAVTAEQAGFEWARDNEVVDACECSGAGRAFQAGCEAYLAATGE